jgi:hypothetical protein
MALGAHWMALALVFTPPAAAGTLDSEEHFLSEMVGLDDECKTVVLSIHLLGHMLTGANAPITFQPLQTACARVQFTVWSPTAAFTAVCAIHDAGALNRAKKACWHHVVDAAGPSVACQYSSTHMQRLSFLCWRFRHYEVITVSMYIQHLSIRICTSHHFPRVCQCDGQ